MSIFISTSNSMGTNQWWKELFLLCAVPGAYFEIHCWLDETKELRLAEEFGQIASFSIQDIKIIHGTLTEGLISKFLNLRKPEDCVCYNKMVPFFTIRIGNNFSSEKYGTEIIMKTKSIQERESLKRILDAISPDASIYQDT